MVDLELPASPFSEFTFASVAIARLSFECWSTLVKAGSTEQLDVLHEKSVVSLSLIGGNTVCAWRRAGDILINVAKYC